MRALSIQELAVANGGENIFGDTMNAFKDGLSNGEIGMLLLGGGAGFIGGLVMNNPIVIGAAGVAAVVAAAYVGYDWYADSNDNENVKA